MKLELLKAGEHMTQRKIDFLYHVVGMIAHSGYRGDYYELVGSRTQPQPHWISYTCLYEYLHNRGVKKSDIDRDFYRLNALAKQLGLCYGQIPELIDHLPSRTPDRIKNMLADPKINHCLGADIDLVIKDIGLPGLYKDELYPKGTGQIVDVFRNVKGVTRPFPGIPRPSRIRHPQKRLS